MAKYYAGPESIPLLFSHFANLGAGDVYDHVVDIGVLEATIQDNLNDFNELEANLDLILVRDVIQHVCRISRILLTSGGHALLVGIGGSGKQSLSRLAAHIIGYETTKLHITASYGIIAHSHSRCTNNTMATARFTYNTHTIQYNPFLGTSHP